MRLLITYLILVAACVGCSKNANLQSTSVDPQKEVDTVPTQAQPQSQCDLSAPIAESPKGWISTSPSTFSWDPTEKQKREYDFVLSNYVTGEVIYEQTGHGRTSLDLPSSVVLEQNVGYIWKVRAKQGNCVSAWSNPWGFYVYDPAFVPSPIGPFAYITNTQPAFTWTSVNSAVSYEIKVVDWNTNSQVFDATTTSTEMPSPENVTFQINDIYVYQIRAVDAQGRDGKWSDPQSFVVYDPAFAPQPTSPAGRITQKNPEFHWAPVENAKAYELEIWQGNVLVYQGACAGGSDQPSLSLVAPFQLTPGATYTWHVRTINTLVQVSNWSEPVNFVISN